MLIYADHVRRTPTRDAHAAVLEWLRRSRTHPRDRDAIETTLIEAGTVESAVADALCPSMDRVLPPLRALRDASEQIGRAFARSRVSDADSVRCLDEAARILTSVDLSKLPPVLDLRVPEGYAFYAVYPDAYVDAALEWASAAAPRVIVCLGLRSIGASLSAAVHGALVDEGIEAQSWTIRPHGHPFDRQPAIDLAIIDAWRMRGSVVLLIDEGPGLSGSSLAGAARFLADHGFDARDVVMLAAWHPDPERFASSSARETWTRHAVITGPFERVRHQVIPYAADWSDISAGRWREHVLNGHVWPPVHPQHERIKLLSSDSRIARFAGLGTYGIAGRERSERLGTAGWTVPPQECQRGFLVSRFVQGCPVRYEDVDRAVVERAAAYLAWLRRHEATPGRAQADSLRDMLIVNVREALGDDAATVAARMADAAAGFHEPAVAIDGRVLLHEWIRTPDGLVKVDALDHHRDHFMPGLADIAWDVAGFIVEARLARQTREDFVDRYAAGSGDRSIRARLEFYTAAYLAFRVGYCAMAGHSVCEADERTRFARAEAVYRRQLRVTLRT